MKTSSYKVDYYARHLMNVNKYNKVIAKENILNADGILLLKKGASFYPEVVEKILNFDLVKPLDESILISRPLTGMKVYQHINHVIKRYSFVEKMHYFANVNLVLKHQCAALGRYPLLIQKMTVQKILQPNEFDKSVMCGWLALGLAKQMKLSAKQIHAVFLAALTHDVGMLHINPVILQRQGEISASEWKIVQSHVELSKKVLDRVENLDSLVKRAVLEHHERCDGMGYPAGKIGNELCLEGQIVAMCDAIIALSVKGLELKKKAFVNVIPFLQLNSEAHFYCTYETLIKWLRNVGYTERRCIPDEEIETLLDGVFYEEFFLKQWHEVINYMVDGIPQTSRDRKLLAVITAKKQLDSILLGSGLVDIGYIKWMHQVKEDKLQSAYHEVEHAYLMLKEVRWELRHITRTLRLIYKNTGDLDAALVQRLSIGFKKLNMLNASYSNTNAKQRSDILH